MLIFRHLVDGFSNPYLICFFLMTLALILLFWKDNSRLGRGLLLIAWIGLLLSSTGFIPRWATYHLQAQYSIVSTVDPEIHWIVVLSGGQSQYAHSTENNVLNNISLARLIESVRLYRLLPNAKIVVSGGGYEPNLTPEAVHMAKILSWFGIPADRIVLESKSINTSGQALKIKPIVGSQPFYLVTSGIHMPRSMALCVQEGLHPVAAPTDFNYTWEDERWENFYVPNPRNLVFLNADWHEFLGRLSMFIPTKLTKSQ